MAEPSAGRKKTWANMGRELEGKHLAYTLAMLNYPLDIQDKLVSSQVETQT